MLMIVILLVLVYIVKFILCILFLFQTKQRLFILLDSEGDSIESLFLIADEDRLIDSGWTDDGGGPQLNATYRYTTKLYL